ncbi:hypothetical protein [Lentibacillus daqui]|uniref:hypothetical protein n=1 Tax=Lentibacillus daqui TaxID=2911514 RepID=UPI0022B15A04|nr:hypothetical protein [Lentibacillus daqui]
MAYLYFWRNRDNYVRENQPFLYAFAYEYQPNLLHIGQIISYINQNYRISAGKEEYQPKARNINPEHADID